MNRSPIQRGRWVVTVGAIVIVASTLMQWWRLGGGPGELPANAGNAFAPTGGWADGAGLLLGREHAEAVPPDPRHGEVDRLVGRRRRCNREGPYNAIGAATRIRSLAVVDVKSVRTTDKDFA